MCRRTCFNGLIQHSFALKTHPESRDFYGERIDQMMAERFSAPGFCLQPVGEVVGSPQIRKVAWHSPLMGSAQTDVLARETTFLGREGKSYRRELPRAFSWAATCEETPGDCKQREPRLILGECRTDARSSCNDFLVAAQPAEAGGANSTEPISQLLLELFAYKRSMLFGLALANRLVNVMLPPALLTPWPAESQTCTSHAMGRWLLQPLVSLIRIKDHRKAFRQIYVLTLLLIPVEDDGRTDSQSSPAQRKMHICEIDCMINAGWSLAMAPWRGVTPRFDLTGPLIRYLPDLARLDLSRLLQARAPTAAGHAEWRCTLRQASETIAFGVGLGMAQGRGRPAGVSLRRQIGRDVITSLGSARVSSVVFIDRRLARWTRIGATQLVRRPPGHLGKVMRRLAWGETRVPLRWTGEEQRAYRVDRNFIDNNTYAVGALPTHPCIVVSSASCAQNGRRESGLLQAGSIAYMAIAAASAIGTIRAIDLELEAMEDVDPRKIAKIEGEVAVDLHEIYDLDITNEAYRRLYRLLRECLGITKDYEALQEKIQALSRETSSRHEVRSQTLLAWLTAAIVALSILILVATLVK